MRLWLKNPLAILAEDSAGGIVVEDGRIVECIGAGGAPARDCDEVVEAGRFVVIPGLINAHHHFFQTMTRAHPAAINKPLFGWLTALYPIWSHCTPQALALATELAMVEMMMSGVTCTSDHHYLFPSGLDEAIDIQVDVARRLGMRAILTRGSMTLSQKDGGLPPEAVVQDDDVVLADSERLLSLYHDPAEGALVQIALAPCSPFSVRPQLMRDTAALARQFDCRLHTHLGETEDENAYCIRHFGLRPMEYLDSVDWMTSRAWLAHGIHFDDGEVAQLGRRGVGVCHCPTSNMVLASGQCRTLELESAGSPVGLGVDGSASNDSSNAMEAVRHALMINRLTYGAEQVTHLDALRWATQGSAQCFGRPELGRIAPGAAADLALFNLDELRFSGAHDPLAALVLCGAHRAERVMIGGRWRVWDSMPVGVDVARLRREHHAVAAALYGRN
ncbi:MAG: amidohydrolase [Caulobacteraceae bacterium]|nr:amidohydrolase [Caulobacteraceae bacterium]